MNQKVEKPFICNIENPDIDWAVRYYTDNFLEYPACKPETLMEQKIDKVIAGIKSIMAFAEENGRFYVENILKEDNDLWEK